MTELDAPEIDLLNLDRFAEGVPHDWFTWLRANDPVHHHAEPDGPGFWVITKLEDVITCSRDFATFSSAAALGGVVGLPEPGPDEEDHSEVTGSLLLYMDPPGHTRYRRLVNRGSGPNRTRIRTRNRGSRIRLLMATRRVRTGRRCNDSPTCFRTTRVPPFLRDTSWRSASERAS